MTLQRNHYEVLGVPRKATTDEIKKKYRELARKFHPDVAKDKVMGQKIFSQINQAYRILGDPDRRAQYDAAIAADTSERSPAAGRPGAASPTNGSNGIRPGTPPTPNGSNGTRPAASNGVGATRPASQPSSPQDAANVARLVADAETAMLQNNIGKVHQICETVLKTDPRNQKAFGLLGEALAGMGRTQEAAAAYRQALQIAPSFALQAKLDRLQGVPRASPVNGATARPTPPTNGATPLNGAARPNPNTTEQGRETKPAGGLFSRFLGKK